MAGIQYPIKLKHTDLLPGSEVITIPGGQYNALVRGQDYEIDYKNGIVTITLTGIVASLPRPPSGVMDLDISYRRKVDFGEEFTLESHIEVFNEVAIIIEPFVLRTIYGPILDVFRVYNRTTGEEYSVDSFINRSIFITGVSPPRNINLTQQEGVLRSRVLFNGQFTDIVGLTLPDVLLPAKEHPIVAVNSANATTLPRILVRGGVNILQSTYNLEVTPDVTGIEILTGSTILRRATYTMVSGTDYVVTINGNTLIMTISFTDKGRAVIGSNSIFYKLDKTYSVREITLSDGENLTESEHRFEFVENFITEVTQFNANNVAPLTKFALFLKKGQEVDEEVIPPLTVTNQAGTIIFVEGRDYLIDKVFKRLVRIETGTLLPYQAVKVVYADEEDFAFDVTIVQDVVLLDYDYGSNAINWSPSIKDSKVTESHLLAEKTRFFLLDQYPVDTNISVYRVLENGIQSIKVEDADITTKRVQIEPAPASTTYLVEYMARSQIFDPSTNYYVSYRYGAQKRALMDNFAALLGLTTGTVSRTEQFDLVNGQNKVVLANVPSDFTKTSIYATGDPDKDPLSTATTFDTSTYTLYFISVISAGNYTFEYPVIGFETEQLRTAVIALLQSFILGPTKASLVQLVQALTGIAPDVIEAITQGFNLTNGSDSDFLNPLPPITSPPLSNGQNSITYEPSRFDMGVSLKAVNGAWIGYNALSNLRIDEGSFSFLLGTFWDGDDGQSHQLFDVVGTDEFTNRMTLYKNMRNSLVFEIHDRDSRLFRVTTDITRTVRNEIIHLHEGQDSVILPYSPAYTILDQNNDGQSDIFGANPTEFVITPVFGGPTGLGMNITTLVQIPDDPTFATESGHFDASYRLQALADVYENHGARLTIQTEKSFMVGCQQFENTLLNLFKRGHDVHLFIQLPQSVISDEDREVYILERRNLLDAIGIKAGESDGVAGGYEIDNFATVFPDLGFDYASAYVNPMTNEGLTGRTDVFRASVGPNFAIPDHDGKLVYMPGDTDIDFQKNPMIVQSFIPITNSLLTAMALAHPDVINSWYFVININDYTPPETELFENWLVQVVEPLVQTGKVFWRTLSGTLEVFREYEKFLEINRNRIRFITEPYGGYGYGGLQEIRALKWDNVTKTLTFTSVDKAGYYLFSYISGFSKYEETEHLITCTWKLHTNDGTPPMMKMFLDGDLVNHKTWGEL